MKARRDYIAMAREVKAQHQYKKFTANGHVEILDAQTANAIVTVYDAVNEANKEKLALMDFRNLATACLKLCH